MEQLKTRSILLQQKDRKEEYQVKEKDHGDMIVYDISRKDIYLMTIARDGSILFMNFDVPGDEKEIFKLSHLQQVIEAIQELNKTPAL